MKLFDWIRFSSSVKSLKKSSVDFGCPFPTQAPIMKGDIVFSLEKAPRIGQSDFLELLYNGKPSILTSMVTVSELSRKAWLHRCKASSNPK